MLVLGIINSIVGKPGNIGYRYNYIKKGLDEQGIKNFTYARGKSYSCENIYTLGILSIVPRALHYLRRNYFKRLNTRRLDFFLFEMFFIFYLPFFVTKFKNHKIRVAYIVESSPIIIKILKYYNFTIVIDVPIAPNNYVLNLLKTKPTLDMVYQKSIDIRERKCLSLADIIIAPSDFVLTEIKKLSNDINNIYVIPFGVNFDNKLIKKGSLDKSGIDYVFAGNISERKGISFLLESWCSEEFKDDRLHLCGSITRAMSKKIKDLQLKNIILPGFVDTKEYFPFCDVYIFPSLMEGSSKSVYEAMNAGLPSIVTYESGSIIRENVDGFIIEALSAGAIKNAMLKVKNINHQILGMKARENVSEYTWDKYTINVIKVLANVK